MKAFFVLLLCFTGPAAGVSLTGGANPNTQPSTTPANSAEAGQKGGASTKSQDSVYEHQFLKYSKMFDAMNTFVKTWGFKPPIQRIKEYFFQDFFVRNENLEKTVPNIVQDLKALAESAKVDAKYDTNIYSVSSNNLANKVLVAGARASNGFRQQYISSIALIEANEGTSSGAVTAYVIMYPDGTERTEAKVSNYPLSSNREGGKYVISYAEGEKQQYGKGNKVVAETKIYRLVAAENYLLFVEYTLIASAASASKGIKSCSIAYIKNVLVTANLKVRTTASGFVTFNEANVARTDSKHYGYFIVDSEDVASLKTTAGLTAVGANVFQSKTKLTEKNFEKK